MFPMQGSKQSWAYKKTKAPFYSSLIIYFEAFFNYYRHRNVEERALISITTSMSTRQGQ